MDDIKMTTILEYPCGCKYYSSPSEIEVMHLCIDHKIQVANDALKDFVKKDEVQ